MPWHIMSMHCAPTGSSESCLLEDQRGSHLEGALRTDHRGTSLSLSVTSCGALVASVPALGDLFTWLLFFYLVSSHLFVFKEP